MIDLLLQIPIKSRNKIKLDELFDIFLSTKTKLPAKTK